MIFPRECKEIGSALDKEQCGQVYFLTKYLIGNDAGGLFVSAITPDPTGRGLMRPILQEQRIASGGEVFLYPEKVQIYDRALLVWLAYATGRRCTVFRGKDEHMTFVCDPDPGALQVVHVYDITPPTPSLSATITELESGGLFGELDICFRHHVRDIRTLDADIFPCRAAGFSRTLDTHHVRDEDRVAGCMTGEQLCREYHHRDCRMLDICPLQAVEEEPFIARCCRSERVGTGLRKGKYGTVVHWGASPAAIAAAVQDLMRGWRA
jgi:hypothetical protein